MTRGIKKSQKIALIYSLGFGPRCLAEFSHVLCVVGYCTGDGGTIGLHVVHRIRKFPAWAIISRKTLRCQWVQTKLPQRLEDVPQITGLEYLEFCQRIIRKPQYADIIPFWNICVKPTGNILNGTQNNKTNIYIINYLHSFT